MLNKISNRVFYMTHNNNTDRPVIGLVCGDKFSLIIDAGNSPNHAKEFLAETATMDISPLKYLAITHWHWDHVFGISTMKIPTIAHSETKKKIDEMKELSWDDCSLDERVKTGQEIEFCRDMMKLEMPNRDELIIGDIDIAFKDCVEIDLGGVQCVIENVGGDHSIDSSIIYVAEEKVMFLGDCIGEDIYSGPRSYSKGKLFPMIEKIRKYDAECYIMSHGSPISKKDMDIIFEELTYAGNFVGDDIIVEQVIKRFINTHERKPNDQETSDINSFVHGNIKGKI